MRGIDGSMLARGSVKVGQAGAGGVFSWCHPGSEGCSLDGGGGCVGRMQHFF